MKTLAYVCWCGWTLRTKRGYRWYQVRVFLHHVLQGPPSIGD